MVSRRTRWLCCREHQRSIKESSHRLLTSQIEKMGYRHLFDVQRDSIKGPHGSEVIFHGLKDMTADSLKSLEDLDGAWVEEAHTVSDHSANILIPTIRNAGSEIWWTYNPDQEEDYVHRMAESGASDVLVVTINWDDNPWFPDELDAERLKLKAINEDLYDHVWGGKCRSIAGLLFKRHWFKRYDPGNEPKSLNIYMAGDYAGGPDPDNPDSDPDWTELGVWGVDSNTELWAVDWWSGQEDPSVWITAWLALIKRHRPLMYFEEKGPILRSVHGTMELSMRMSPHKVIRQPLDTAGNKASRAMGFAAKAAAGTVWIPNTPWGDRLINQLCAFNGQDGRTDDMVDVCSLFGRGIDMVWPTLVQQEKPAPDLTAMPTISEFMTPAKKAKW
jgi:phage terminase large subunit-like protein